MVTLKESGPTQLWSIPPEIKYYFLLPILCLPAALQRFKISCLVIIVLLIAINLINMRINLFGVKTVPKDFPLWCDQKENFKFCLQYFLNGSLIAFSLFYLENYFKSFFEIRFKDFFTNILSICLIVAGIHYDNSKCLINTCYDSLFQPHYPISNLIWSLALFMMFISKENTNIAKKMLEKSSYLQEAGKLSFGIYLWHPMGNFFYFYSLLTLKN